MSGTPLTRADLVDSLDLAELLELQASAYLPPDVFWLAWDRIDLLTQKPLPALYTRAQAAMKWIAS